MASQERDSMKFPNKRIAKLYHIVKFFRLNLSNYEDRRKLQSIIYLFQLANRKKKRISKGYKFALTAIGLFSQELSEDIELLKKIMSK
jgi:uncharacterized protein YwgA